MAIDSYVASIRSASYGSEVRNAIANALTECYNLAVANANNSYVSGVRTELTSIVNGLRSDVASLRAALNNIHSFTPSDLNGVTGRVSNLETDVSALKTQKTVHNTDISSLKTRATALESDVDQLQRTVSGIHSFTPSDLASVNQQITAITTRLLELETGLSSHENDADRLAGVVSRLQGDYTALSSIVNGLTALSGTDQQIAELQSRLTTIWNGFEAHINAASAQAADDKALLLAKYAEVSAAMTVAMNEIDDYVATHESDLRSVNAGVESFETRMIQRIEALIAQHNADLNSLHQTINGEMDQLNAQNLLRDQQLREEHDRDIRDVRREISRVDSYAVGVATRHENDMENVRAEMEIVANGIAEVKEAQESLVSDILKDGDSFYGINLKGNRITQYITGIGGSGSGGGSGGGSSTKVETKVSMTMPVLSPENGQIRKGDPLLVSFSWSSILDDQPTGKGTIIIYVRNVKKAQLKNRNQGDVSVDIGPYLDAGSSTIRVEVVDSYDNSTYRRFDVECIDLLLTSTFNSSTTYSGPIQFRCTPHSSGEKTIHVALDDVELEPLTTLSQREVTYSIPAQNHGKHTIDAWYTIVLNGDTLESNHLYYEFIALEIGQDEKILVSDFNVTEMEQYDSAQVPFKIYDPSSMTAEVSFYENNVLKYTGTFDRNTHYYALRADDSGTLTFKMVSGNTQKEWEIAVTPSTMDIHAETDGLALYLTPIGRSNGEQNPASWTYQDVPITLSGIDWDTDGWQTDENGNTMLRLRRGGRVEIGFQPFAEDIRSSGMLIEIEFAIRNVEDFDTTACSCYSGGRGFFIKPNLTEIHSESSSLRLNLKEEEHTRLSFAIDKRNDGRMMMAYINSIPQQAVKYSDVDDFSQVTPVGITFGSDYCDVDIYCVRIYNHNLLPRQILDNFIADTQNGLLKRERYLRNNIYDDDGNIDPEKLPIDLPYMFLEVANLPTAKTDEGIPGDVEFVDQERPEKSFTATGVKMNGQGTTSILYPVKNIDLQFKKGFDQQSGHASEYALGDTVIPFNRFVLKADYASSEGANNVIYCMLFNDLNPYTKREKTADPRVRDGIYGRPIVCFHRNPETKEITFVGKYNFNLPKRAPGPYGYSGNQESWEFENNSPGLMWFTSDVFDETLVRHPDTGEMVPKWTLDFEARFPSSDWMDYSKLQELETFVVSTNRDAATNETLPAPVEYDGVTYNKDTAEYRLAKFKNDIGSYCELSSLIYYYVLGEWALDMDGWGKNLFLGFVGDDVTAENRVADRKAITEPYDKDTIWGINNEGALVFDYWIENRDTVNGKRPHTSYGSVLWNNLQDAFPAEISQRYGNLRANGLSYDAVEARVEAHQNHWPEAIWIDDTWYKYVNQPTTEHWPKLQGDKRQQRKYFMDKRTKYYDSKWNAGSATADRIQLRGYAVSDITLKTRMKMYATVVWASTYMTQERVEANATTVMHCPLDGMNDTEIYINSASEIVSCGDLSGLYTGEGIFSAARNLTEIHLGSSDTNYENGNLHKFEAGSENRPMPLLTSIDIRGCTGLGLADQTTGYIQETVDLRYCEQLNSFLGERTNFKSVLLPRGTRIQHLHLPSTITQLILLDANKLTDLVAPIGQNFSTLWIENSSHVDTKSLLLACPSATRVRLIGVNWECSTGDDLVALFTHIRLMRGLDENGDAPTPDVAQISGSVHTGTLSAENTADLELLGYPQNFPYLTLTYDHTAVTLTFKNEDGSQSVGSKTVIDGGDGDDAGITRPSKASTAQYNYTFAGWSTTPGGSANANALKAMTANRTVYAAYTATVQSYTVIFNKDSADGGGTLQSSTWQYGQMPSYSGATPTTTKGSATDYPFQGWTPAIATVTGNATYTARFGSPKTVAEVTDMWELMFGKLNTNSYKAYKVGYYKNIDLGTEGSGKLSIVGIDADECANGLGTAPFSVIIEFALNTDVYFTTAAGNAWDTSNLRNHILNNIVPLIPYYIRDRIVPVKKYTRRYGDANEVIANYETAETVYALSKRELGYSDSYETLGPVYSSFFNDTASKIMYKNGSNEGARYWTRTPGPQYYNSYTVTGSGNASGDFASNRNSVVVGFCLGTSAQLHLKPDSLSQIKEALRDGTYSSKYSIGDMFELSQNGVVTNYIQIIDFLADDKSDGSGKAKMTCAMFYAVNGTSMYNTYQQGVEGTGMLGGWEKTLARSYLQNNIYSALPQELKNMIVPVDKYSTSVDPETEQIISNAKTTDTLFLFSRKEVTGQEDNGTNSPIYTFFSSNMYNRIRYKKDQDESVSWALRNAVDRAAFGQIIWKSGNYGSTMNPSAGGTLVYGFCLDA